MSCTSVPVGIDQWKSVIPRPAMKVQSAGSASSTPTEATICAASGARASFRKMATSRSSPSSGQYTRITRPAATHCGQPSPVFSSKKRNAAENEIPAYPRLKIPVEAYVSTRPAAMSA